MVRRLEPVGWLALWLATLTVAFTSGWRRGLHHVPETYMPRYYDVPNLHLEQGYGDHGAVIYMVDHRGNTYGSFGMYNKDHPCVLGPTYMTWCEFKIPGEKPARIGDERP